VGPPPTHGEQVAKRTISVIVAVAGMLTLPGVVDAAPAPARPATAAVPSNLSSLAREPARAPSPPYDAVWEREVDDEDWWRPVVGAEETFVVGTRPHLADADRVRGFDAETGEVRWERRLPGLRWSNPYRSAVHGDSVVIASTSEAEGHDGQLIALDGSSGQVRWQVAAKVDSGAQPIIDDEGTSVVLSTVEDVLDPWRSFVEKRLYVRAYDLATGRLRWEVLGYRERRYWETGRLTVAVGEGAMVLGSLRHMAAYDLRTGGLRWQTEDDFYDGDPYGSGYAVGGILDGTVTASFREGALVHDLATGRALRPAPTGWAVSGPMTVNHRFRYGGSAGLLEGVDVRTGRQQWTLDLFDRPDASFHELLFAHGHQSELVVADTRDGRILWTTGPGVTQYHSLWAQAGDTLLRSSADGLLAVRTVAGAVDRVEPSVTAAGEATSLRLHGRGFAGAIGVRVGDDDVAEVEVRSDREVAVVVPPLTAGFHDVQVLDADGEPLPLGSRARLQVVAVPDAPTLSPAVGRPLGGTTVSLAVADADLVEAVEFGILPVPIVARTPDHVEVRAPAGTGEVPVRVRTLAGWSPAVPFSYAGTPLAVSPAGTVQIDATHDNVQDEELGLPLAERWRVDLHGTPAGYPVIAEGKVFLVEGGRLRAMDAATGRTIWGPLAINAATVSYGDGRVYVTSRMRVVALDAESGVVLWIDDADRALHSDVWSEHAPTTYAAGRLLVGAPERLTALDAATGDVVWADDRRHEGHVSPSVIGGLVLAARSGGVNAHDLETGAEVWRQTSYAISGGASSAMQIAGDVAHEPGSNFAPSSARALTTGESVWTHPPEAVSRGAAYHGDVAVFGKSAQYEQGLSAFQPSTGARLWTLRTAATASLTADRSHAYQVDDAGTVRAVDLVTGEVVWEDVTGLDPQEWPDAVRGFEPYTGAAVGDGLLVVQVGDVVIAYGSVPDVDAVAPRIALPGEAVAVTGSGFAGATAVTFGGLPATTFEVVDDGTITAVPPLGITRAVDVRVSTADGTSPVVVGDRYGLLGSGPALLPPVITELLSPTLVLGGVAVDVSLTGSGFVDGATVSAPGVVFLDVDVVSPERITARALAPLGVPAGVRAVTVTNPDGASGTLDAVLEVVDPPPDPVGVDRLSGADRVATAVAVSQDLWTDAAGEGPNAQAVVLARADSFPDALAGGPLAAHLEAPILLTPSGALDGRVLAEVQRVLPAGGDVHVLGGPSSIDPSVASALAAAGFEVTRHGGATRFETAVAIAEAIGEPAVLLAVTGQAFPDGLAAGAAAARWGGAVLLTDGPRLPAATAAYLAAHRGVPVRAIGGPAGQALPDAPRVAGADRYATALLVAQQLFPTTVPLAGLASGERFPDALVAGPHVGPLGGPLLLSQPTALPAGVGTYLADRVTGRVVLYGGPSVLGPVLPALG
jgi:outer membrane protein assembly factor BamB